MRKLNKNNIHYHSTTEINWMFLVVSAAGLCAVSHCQTISATCRVKSHLYQACDVASKQSRLEPGRLCSVGALHQRVNYWLFETGTAETGNRGWVVHAVSKVHWSQYQCMATSGMCCKAKWQTWWTSFKIIFSNRPTLHCCYSLHICELLARFINLLYKLHIYTHAALCGATYRSTVKLSYINYLS